MEETVQTGEKWSGETTIKNPEIVENLIDSGSYTSDYDEMDFKVNNPYSGSEIDPEFLRIGGYRKALWFRLIEDLQDLGFRVADVWQSDSYKESDALKIKIKPRDDI